MIEYDLVVKIRNFFGLLILFSLAVLLVFPKLNIEIGVIYSLFLFLSLPIFFILFLIISLLIMAVDEGGIVQLVNKHLYKLPLVMIICISSLLLGAWLKLEGNLALLFLVTPMLILFAIFPLVYLGRLITRLDALILKISKISINKKERAK